MSHMTLMRLYMPWHAQRNTHADTVERNVTSFAREMGLDTQYFADTNTLFAYLHPNAEPMRLQVVGKLYALCWFLDDVWDGNLPQSTLEALDIHPDNLYGVIRDVGKIIRDGALPANPGKLHYAFHDVWQSFCQTAERSWLYTFAETVLESLLTSHTTGQAHSTIRTLNDYLALRDKDAGGIYTCLLMEYANQIFLPVELREHAVLHKLRILACRIGGLGNDLVSFHKEYLQDENSFNAIAFMMDSKRMSFEEAATIIIEKHNELVEEFLYYAQDAVEWSNLRERAQVRAYITGLEEIMSGTLAWELQSRRYRTENALFPELELEQVQVEEQRYRGSARSQ